MTQENTCDPAVVPAEAGEQGVYDLGKQVKASWQGVVV